MIVRRNGIDYVIRAGDWYDNPNLLTVRRLPIDDDIIGTGKTIKECLAMLPDLIKKEVESETRKRR